METCGWGLHHSMGRREPSPRESPSSNSPAAENGEIHRHPRSEKGIEEGLGKALFFSPTINQ